MENIENLIIQNNNKVMKHLKKFNESVNEYDLKDYCETNLAYLMDEGLEVKIGDYEGDLSVDLYLYGRPWSEIKDQIIPFLYRFNNVYEINSLEDGSDKFIEVQVSQGNYSKYHYIYRYRRSTLFSFSISYDELENLPEETLIEKIVFFLK